MGNIKSHLLCFILGFGMCLAVLIPTQQAEDRKEVVISPEITYCYYVNLEMPKKELVYTEQEKLKSELSYYETLTKEEINLLEVVIQHEVGNFSPQYKTLIAELIYNRIKSEHFPNTVKEVLYQENQFCGIEQWYYPDYPVDEDTKQVIKDVFSKDITTHNATFYYNPALSEYESIIWFEYSGDITFLFDHTESSYGINYNTRFFNVNF